MPDLMEFSKEKAHSPLGASSMYRWSACPGSVKLSKEMPESTPSAYAMEGTKAHEIAAIVLNSGAWPEGVDSETKADIEIYTDFVQELWKRVHKYTNSKFLVEHRFELTKVKDGLFGTADAVIFDDRDKVLHVIDLKFGAGIFVEVENNPQLMYYALGALLSLDVEPELIEMTIVQPRCSIGEPVRSTIISPQQLLDFSLELYAYAEQTEASDAPLRAGSHCRFCPGAPICPEIKRRSQSLIETSFSEVYDPKLLSTALHFIPAFSEWAKNVEEFALQELKAGKKIPGFKLVEKRTNRKWRDESEALEVIRTRTTADLTALTETKLLSPAKMEKIIEKKIVEELTIQPSGGLTIAKENDKRDEISIIEFSKV